MISNGFKETEIGVIPDDWERDILGNRCRIFSGFAFKSSDFVSSGITVVKIGNLQNGTLVIDNRTSYFPEDKITKQHHRYILKEDDVLIALTGATTGKIAVVPQSFQSALLNQRVGKFEIDRTKLNQRFFRFYALTDSFQKNIHDNILQSAQGNVSPQKIESFEVMIPGLAEQQKIASVLSKIQQAITQQEQVIAKTKELKRSLMHRLFTQGLRGEELKETEIGEIPRSWEIIPLEQLVEIVYGAQAAVAHALDSSIGIPIFTNVNITNDGELDLSILRYYKVMNEKRDRLILKKGDILFNWRSGSKDHVGKSAFFDLDGEYTFSSFILRFRAKEAINNIYLYWYLQFLKSINYFSQYRDQSSVNSVFNASAAAVIPIVVCEKEEQLEIGNALGTVNDKIKEEQNRLAIMQSLFKTMLNNLMTGKVRVKDIDFSDVIASPEGAKQSYKGIASSLRSSQ